MAEPSCNARREWTPEEQQEIDRTVRALSLSGILDWESRIDALEKPGRRLIEPPVASAEAEPR